MAMFTLFGVMVLLGGFSILVAVVFMLSTSARKNQNHQIHDYSETYDHADKRYHKNTPIILSIAALFCVVIVGGITFTVRIARLDESLLFLENQVSSLHNALWQSNNTISVLRNELNELQTEDDYVERFTYDFEAVTEEGEGIIELSIYMKRLPTEGTVHLVIENSQSEITTLDLEHDSMIIQKSLTLELDESYDLSVVVIDGTQTVREELRTLDMNRMLNGYYGVKIEEDWEEEYFAIIFTVYNNYSLNELLAFKEVWIEEYNEEGTISTKLFTVPDVDVNHYEEFHYTLLIDFKIEYNVMVKITAVDHFNHEIVLFEGGF